MARASELDTAAYLPKPLVPPLPTVLAGDEASLSNQELLEVVLGNRAAADTLVRRYVSLASMAQVTVPELERLNGVGNVTAAKVRVIFELAKRLSLSEQHRGKALSSSKDSYQVVKDMLQREETEQLLVLALNSRNRLLREPFVVVSGSQQNVVVEPREVLRPLVITAATGAVLAHNHPSGDPSPSSDDIALTRKVFEACALLGIRLLDHIIVGDSGYTSLANKGYI